MGLFDGMLGSLVGGGASSGGGLAAMIPALLNSFGQQQPGAQPGMAGGLSALVNHLQQGGLGPQVQSWIGTGPNPAVTPEQVQNALPPQQVQGMAGQAGVPVAMLLSLLAQNLPMLIDRMTPHGRLPTEQEAEQHVQSMQAGEGSVQV